MRPPQPLLPPQPLRLLVSPVPLNVMQHRWDDYVTVSRHTPKAKCSNETFFPHQRTEGVPL